MSLSTTYIWKMCELIGHTIFGHRQKIIYLGGSRYTIHMSSNQYESGWQTNFFCRSKYFQAVVYMHSFSHTEAQIQISNTLNLNRMRFLAENIRADCGQKCKEIRFAKQPGRKVPESEVNWSSARRQEALRPIVPHLKLLRERGTFVACCCGTLWH